ncbi:MAG: FecR domain-containing protein [Deltaproteobacteria bacterium]|nr:FecR domain-containing protein [Deltaproteobacteria bacterium]
MFARLVALFVFLAVTPVLAANTGGKLSKVEGQVFVRPPSGDETQGQAGVALIAGTRIRTGKNSSAEVVFADGSLLKLRSNSSILLSGNKRQKQKSSILLFFGHIWSKVSPSPGHTSYEVSTPNAVCGVRGTEFATQVGDDGSLRMQVTEGKVAVDGDSDGSEQVAQKGQQVEANEQGINAPNESSNQPSYEKWQGQKRERLRKNGKNIVQSMKGRILSRKEKLEKFRAEQQKIEQARKEAMARAKEGDKAAIDEIRQLNQKLADLADEIADIGDEANAGFGAVDHFADLANDPRFKLVGKKYIKMEAASLRRIKANLDKMVAEGTDMSMEAMDKMLDDMSKGKGTLREKKGSAADDLFGPDGEMDMH